MASSVFTQSDHLEFSSLTQRKSGTHDLKPFSLPSLASITANLAVAPTEPSFTGPHRKSFSLSISGRRRFSPLGNSVDYGDPASPLESELSGEGRSSVSGISLSIASGHRPRSHSLLSGHSVIGNYVESDAPADESASDSGGSDKKPEDNDASIQVKKRSRTLTTPSQQRRLMQILEKTRFPSTEVREQLARELGMTPRRVQIWFQNRRQGMKKALEQKAEQEVSETSTPDMARRGCYSFGANPPPADAYGQPALQSFPEGQPAMVDGFPQQYSSRSVSRGAPPGLAPLELSTATTFIHEPVGTTAGHIAWSDSSSAASLYCFSSAVGGEVNCSPFAKPDQQYHPDSDLTHSQATFGTEGRHRSQTHPDFLGMINGLVALPELGRSSQQPIDFQQNTDGSEGQMFMSAQEHPLSVSGGWSNSYIQSAPAWQEGLENLKLGRHTCGLDPSIQTSIVGDDPMYNSAFRLTDPSNNYYYSGGIRENISSDNSLASYNREDDYMGNIDTNTPEADLTQHFRNRSQSLHF
ncbi:hypothetical protein VP01_1513g3 [Puccinia sorghi]|uniref:Homeobox domain-containing protein n=1 Tax=Puccinia sorghi TaxID=27349 RepID=A0A0L6VIU4_9BASI|nr:hypothetical protein VP01_1513g3 [Puccinia sorghi]